MRTSVGELYGLDNAKNLSYREIAFCLCIGFGTVSRIMKLFELTGYVSITKSLNRAHLLVLDDFHEFFILELILECPSMHLLECVYWSTKEKFLKKIWLCHQR